MEENNNKKSDDKPEDVPDPPPSSNNNQEKISGNDDNDNKKIMTIGEPKSTNNQHPNHPKPEDENETEIPVFSELSQLCQTKDGTVTAWKETARWVKYEERVEANGTRWSKPYVSTVNVAAFQELRESLQHGVVLFDTPCYSLDQVAEEFCRILRKRGLASPEESRHIQNSLLSQKLHLFQTKRSLMRSLADMKNNSSNNFLKLLSGSTTKINQCATVPDSTPKHDSVSDSEDNGDNSSNEGVKSKHGSASNLQTVPKSDSENQFKFNDAFMRKLPDNVVSNNILIGEVDFLQHPVSGFIRLQSATVLGNMTEVSIPTKFIFIYLGPKNYHGPASYVQIGRALATLMSDSIFRQVAIKAQNIGSLVAALDDFLNESPILPPNLWDPSTRIEPPEKTPSATGGNRRHPNEFSLLQKDRSIDVSLNTVNSSDGENTVNSRGYYNGAFFMDSGDSKPPAILGNGAGGGGSKKDFESYVCYINEKMPMDSDDEEELERKQNGLVRTGRLFGGMINDIKRKLPHYKSDFTDALAMQSIASVVFLYFACLTPIITFGGLLGDATGNNIATMESLVCGCLCGIVYGLFSGQPLTILGSTGPVLVFETIVFDFCRTYDYNYLALRFWIGIWTAAILMTFVAFDLSFFVSYITRFTEENFAVLISVIFMYKSVEKLFKINRELPVRLHPEKPLDCHCIDGNTSTWVTFDTDYPEWRNKCLEFDGNLYGSECEPSRYVPDVFLFSFILWAFTYIISVKLKSFINTRYFTSNIRQMVSDFAVPIAIVVMTVIDNLTGIPTPKLQVPNDFKPTLPSRTWLVSPLAEENPSWLPFAAVFPALLATILIFMDQQITAVIVNRKENKLKKGCGYHLDLFVLSILIAICSIFGLPWFVAATVLSITHVNSLKMVSQSSAPGDRPKFLGVREQRVTHISIFILCGLSIFFTSVLQRIPMAVLYGVFLYMGVSSLDGSQFIERIAIMFMPQKYQPDYMFLRSVKMYRVHMFTIIQIICFIFLWVVKSSKPISITFPLMLVVILGIRKLLDYVFTQEELKILDDKMPESKRKKKERTKQRLSVIKLNLEKQQQHSNGTSKKTA